MATVLTPNPSISGRRMSSSTYSLVGLTFPTFDVCEGAVHPWPAASSVPSEAHRRLSRRKPTETLSLLTGVCPRDKRMKDWLPHPPIYSHLPSLEISRPFGPAASLMATARLRIAIANKTRDPNFNGFDSQGDEPNFVLDLFEDRGVPDAKLHRYFVDLRDSISRSPAKKVLQAISPWLATSDANLVKEFQEIHFDQRLWEIYI